MSSENWHCEQMDESHLWSVIDHANSQIDIYTRRAEQAMAQLICRGLVEVVTEN